MGPAGESRVAQIHPTRTCNLQCRHCYSSSSPTIKEILPPAVLKGLLNDLAAENYDRVSFSGGEPMLYPFLAESLRHARKLGLSTTLVTNGILLNEARLDTVAPLIDFMAISLDGRPESHNHIRNQPRAFEMMAARLEDVRAHRIPFGFLFTLTQTNLDELIWVIQFALEQKASLIQIHPLENVGAASLHMAELVPDATEAAYAFALQHELQQTLGNELHLQLDLFYSEAIRQDPARFFATPGAIDRQAPLGEILSPLIVETDGTVVPMEYGFPRRFALGNLHYSNLRALARNWRNHGADAFEALCAETYRRATEVETPQFWNWYELLQDVATGWHREPQARAAVIG